MTEFTEQDLEKVSGGGIAEIINTNDVVNYIQVLSECPGVIDRLRAGDLSDADLLSIQRHFPSVDRFIAVAKFAHDKTVEELMEIAAKNDAR